MISLTAQQKRLRDFIAERVAAGGVAPSMREMAREMGLAGHGNVARLLDCLEKRGAIRRAPNCARAIEVLEEGQATELLLHTVPEHALVNELVRRGWPISTLSARAVPGVTAGPIASSVHR